MRISNIAFDPVQALAGIGWILLAVGVLPFTPACVGVLAILAMCHLTFEFKW